MKFERQSRDYLAHIQINLRDGSTLSFTAVAVYVDQMKRDAKGHPVKGGTKGLPKFDLHYLGDWRWYPLPDKSEVEPSSRPLRVTWHVSE